MKRETKQDQRRRGISDSSEGRKDGSFSSGQIKDYSRSGEGGTRKEGIAKKEELRGPDLKDRQRD